jgi:hypothetical protein
MQSISLGPNVIAVRGLRHELDGKALRIILARLGIDDILVVGGVASFVNDGDLGINRTHPESQGKGDAIPPLFVFVAYENETGRPQPPLVGDHLGNELVTITAEVDDQKRETKLLVSSKRINPIETVIITFRRERDVGLSLNSCPDSPNKHTVGPKLYHLDGSAHLAEFPMTEYIVKIGMDVHDAKGGREIWNLV